jgi:hypothetical protein
MNQDDPQRRHHDPVTGESAPQRPDNRMPHDGPSRRHHDRPKKRDVNGWTSSTKASA